MSPAIPWLGELLSLTCALLWAFTVILFKRAEHLSSGQINLMKNVLAWVLIGLTFAGVAIMRGTGFDMARSTGDWLRLIVSGVLGLAIGDLVFLEGLRRVGPSMMAIVDCAYAPTVVLVSVAMNGESVTAQFTVGACLVLVGVAIASLPDGRGDLGGRPRTQVVSGVLIGLVAVIIMGFGIALAKPALDRSDVLEAAFVRISAALVVQLLFTGMSAEGRTHFALLASWPAWKRVIPPGVLGSYVSMIVWIAGFKYTLGAVAAVINQSSSVFTLLLARLIYGERLSPIRAIGAAMSLIGVVVVVLSR